MGLNLVGGLRQSAGDPARLVDSGILVRTTQPKFSYSVQLSPTPTACQLANFKWRRCITEFDLAV